MSESNETKLPKPALINLEGLKGAVLASVPVRDELGYTRNLALPCTDEGVRFDTLLGAFGLDTLFVSFESQVDEDSPAQAEYVAGNGCAGWTPVAPDGEGWHLAEVYDTEDGAYAMFVRETPPTVRVSRREARDAALAAPPNFERMFNAACVDLGLINEALGLNPDDGGAAPILAAIAKLKSASAPSTETSGDQAPSDASIEQYLDGLLADRPMPNEQEGQTWYWLTVDELRSFVAHFAAPQLVERKAQPVSDNGAVAAEAAPPNKLPSWDECAMRVANSDFLAKRVSEGGYGPDHDSKTATELHRFIHEYDDSDPYRSAWFMHRLEKLLDEVRTLSASQAHGKSEAVIAELRLGLGQIAAKCFKDADLVKVKCCSDIDAILARSEVAPAADAAVVAQTQSAQDLLKPSALQALAEQGLTPVLFLLKPGQALPFATPKSNPSQSTGDSVRVEGDAKDAARYRWLRQGGKPHVRGDWSGYLGDYCRLHGEQLDDTIDAALAQQAAVRSQS